MTDIFAGYVDWHLNKRFGGAPTIGEQAEWTPAETIAPKPVSQPQFTKPTTLQEKVAEGIGTFVSDLENRPVESAYGMAKGAVQGTVGSMGDLVSIAKGIYYATQTPEGKSKAEEFIKGMESATGAPTSDDVKQFLDQFIPSGPRSTEAAGELVSLGKVAGKAAKGVAKAGAKVLTNTKAK